MRSLFSALYYPSAISYQLSVNSTFVLRLSARGGVFWLNTRRPVRGQAVRRQVAAEVFSALWSSTRRGGNSSELRNLEKRHIFAQYERGISGRPNSDPSGIPQRNVNVSELLVSGVVTHPPPKCRCYVCRLVAPICEELAPRVAAFNQPLSSQVTG